MKKLMIINLVLLVLILGGCTNEVEDEKLSVAVSILPQEAFVKGIAGDLVDVVTLIPPGASPTNYQPSPQEMSKFSNSKVYFTIGVPTEESNILPMVEDMEEDIILVELEDMVDAVYSARYFDDEDHDENQDEDQDEDHDEDHNHEGRDPHIWLSPKRVEVMIEVITSTLIELDPENEEIYKANSQAYIKKLQIVDEEIKETVDEMDHKAFIIMHPSLGYFADDYGLHMVAIEEDGKESSSTHLQEVIEYAVSENINVIFYQAEFDSSQAETIADEIDGSVIQLDTLSNEYLNNMRTIAEALKEGQEGR